MAMNFSRSAGLPEIKGRAEFACAGPILRRIRRSDHNRGHVSATAALPNPCQDLIAGTPGQVQVDHKKVGTALGRILVDFAIIFSMSSPLSAISR